MWDRIKAWRRDRVLAKVRLDDGEWQEALQRFPFTRGLTAAEREQLRELTIAFLHEKHFSSTHGLELTDAMRLHVAIQACTLILHLGIDYYRGWSEIIVYPAEFIPRHEYTDESGVVHQGDEPYAGEAWLQGPVVLSWADVAEMDIDGFNVVIHEFAHKLDMLNGSANGFPPLHKGMTRQAWVDSFSSAYEDFCARVDADEDTIIDPYASESPGEFFAVMSEAYFELPQVVLREYPAVYEQFALFYKQDPLARLEPWSEESPATPVSPGEGGV